MRLFVSFILAFVSYILIICFLYFLFPKPIKQKQILIHTAIVTKDFSLKNHVKKVVNTPFKKISKPTSIEKTIKKTKSKTSITKSGNVGFNDIFKNVKANVPTTPIHLKKQLLMSRFKGNNILKNLSKIKSINVNISYTTNKISSNIKQSEVDELINKVAKVWYQISDIAGEYAIIKIIVNNSQINAIILDSNLNRQKQQMLISYIKNIKFNKNVELNIKFQTKVNR